MNLLTGHGLADRQASPATDCLATRRAHPHPTEIGPHPRPAAHLRHLDGRGRVAMRSLQEWIDTATSPRRSDKPTTRRAPTGRPSWRRPLVPQGTAGAAV